VVNEKTLNVKNSYFFVVMYHNKTLMKWGFMYLRCDK